MKQGQIGISLMISQRVEPNRGKVTTLPIVDGSSISLKGRMTSQNPRKYSRHKQIQKLTYMHRNIELHQSHHSTSPTMKTLLKQLLNSLIGQRRSLLSTSKASITIVSNSTFPCFTHGSWPTKTPSEAFILDTCPAQAGEACSRRLIFLHWRS